MSTSIIRVWLPDRPGALGAVTTAVGLAGAEIVGIDILEQGGGRAIDELAVQIDPSRLDGLVAQIVALDGVDVEEVRAVDGGVHDPRSDVLEAAARLVECRTAPALHQVLVTACRQVLGASWAAVVDADGPLGVVASAGPAPAAEWLTAFVAGSRAAGNPSSAGADDVLWAPLPASALAYVLGRDANGFHDRERRQVTSLARIADAHLDVAVSALR